MDTDDFKKGKKASRIVWHRAHQIAGQRHWSIDAGVFAGEVIFANGERGTYIGSEAVGTTNDPGAFSGTAIIVLEDGSVSRQTFDGQTEAPNGSDRLTGTGAWKMDSGTGRFDGLSGAGSFKWSMIGDDYEEEFSS
jgi:hypothetical protein